MYLKIEFKKTLLKLFTTIYYNAYKKVYPQIMGYSFWTSSFIFLDIHSLNTHFVDLYKIFRGNT